jgi:hypothetical protein
MNTSATYQIRQFKGIGAVSIQILLYPVIYIHFSQLNLYIYMLKKPNGNLVLAIIVVIKGTTLFPFSTPLSNISIQSMSFVLTFI